MVVVVVAAAAAVVVVVVVDTRKMAERCHFVPVSLCI